MSARLPAHDDRPDHDGKADLPEVIASKAGRRARSRREGRHNMWFGIGMFGLVGWAVTVPTLAGIAGGVWLDRRFPDGPSWALTGLVAGVILGSFNAWWWVRRTGMGDNATTVANEKRHHGRKEGGSNGNDIDGDVDG